jgi:hypothetical protein
VHLELEEVSGTIQSAKKSLAIEATLVGTFTGLPGAENDRRRTAPNSWAGFHDYRSGLFAVTIDQPQIIVHPSFERSYHAGERR